MFRCPLGASLSAGDRAVVTVESRLWERTAVAMGQERLRVSSKLVARVASLQYGLTPEDLPLTLHYVGRITFHSFSLLFIFLAQRVFALAL